MAEAAGEHENKEHTMTKADLVGEVDAGHRVAA